MLKISNIRIENNCYLCADIDIDGETNRLWYKTNEEYSKYLCDERADAFVVGLLLYAMEKEQDIEVIGKPITSKLFQNLNATFIPALSRASKSYKEIRIIATTTNEKLNNEGLNGTGISCGIDSFATIAEYTSKSCPEELKVNCLTLFNMGASGDYGGEEARNLFNERKIRGKQFADEYGFKFVEVDSNLSEIIKMNFYQTHTLRNSSAALALQKLFKNYYYSSGTSVIRFKLGDENPAPYDTFSLSMISNENISFYSIGTPYNRIEKTEIVSNYKPSYKYLNVCVREDSNCCMCEKCKRTILGLEAIGKLQLYKDVFNMDLIEKNKKKYIYYLTKKVYLGIPWYKDIYLIFKKNRYNIPLYVKIKAFIVGGLLRDVPRKIVEKIKRIRENKKSMKGRI